MKFIPTAVGVKLARTALVAQKNSPQILFVAGVVGSVGSTVLACRATLKVNQILNESHSLMHKTELAIEQHPDEYSETDKMKDRTLIRYQTAVKIGRAYAPAAALGILSIAALTRSHSILLQRNNALIAAYAALDRGFKEYRARVVAKYGEEADRDMRYGIREITTTDPTTHEERTIKRVAPGEPSVYARFFDETSPSWNRDPEVNRFFLQSQQNYANDQLISRGHVFLNEVYDLLGMERSSAGSVVGWVVSHNGSTDNHISFGIFDSENAVKRDFVNGFEGAILLDFNVDGVIYDKIDSLPEELRWQLNQ